MCIEEAERETEDIQNLEGSAISYRLRDTTRQTVVPHITDCINKNKSQRFHSYFEKKWEGKEEIHSTYKYHRPVSWHKSGERLPTKLFPRNPLQNHITTVSSSSQGTWKESKASEQWNTYRYWRTSFQYISLGISPLSLFCARSLEDNSHTGKYIYS